ncbi:SpoIIE family protein phosphatase [Pumilibacter muris]|uniref:SpoIIE family protein phosphatase n=1 Tax=Pumilibacter muris TaxID=2941510 RepID=UPI00203FE2B0|nr:SpoIIE family protein phosphatase [Pumilibacter muris]
MKYVFMLFSLAALCGAEFSGMRPCGAGFAAALVYCGMPAIVVLPAYMGFSLIFDFSLETFLYALAVSVVSFAAGVTGLKFTRAKRAVFLSLFAAAQCSLLLMHSTLGYLRILVWSVLAAGIFVSSVCFLRPVLVQKLKYKFLETELVCGGVLLICASLGLGKMQVEGFDAAYLLAAFAIPFAAGVGSLSGSVAVAICFGCGIALGSEQVAPIAFMAFAALVTAIFAEAPRPISSLSTAAAYVLAAYLFSAPPLWQQILCFAVGALSFAFVPKSLLGKVRDVLFAPVTATAARGIVNRAASETGKNLLGASQIFADMKIAMEQVPDAEETSVLEKNVCSRCSGYAQCSQVGGYREALDKMERSSAAKGRASVSEVPALLSTCGNLAALISGATESAQLKHEQLIVSEARREGRNIVAKQLGLMSEVLKQMGNRVKEPAKFDTAKEKRIAEELSYRGAVVPEVIVTDETVSVVLQSEELTNEQITSAVSKTMHAPYRCIRGGADVLPGYTLLLFAKAPRYDVAFSAAASAKETRSGDSHSFIRLGGDRFMMTLCDGMGSGDAARKASETAIELVESFFKAGLDSMSAVECVNRFLALNECERFSTLDITVIDLNSGVAEIIKLSSPATVIKTAEGVRAISGSALPMGVFEQVQCGHSTQNLRSGDEIIMATDGVTDALGSTESLIAAAATSNACEPQAKARELLEYATAAQRGKLRDDGTVLCARIFEKKY